MGLFDVDDNTPLENADLDCEPQNEFANKKEVKKLMSIWILGRRSISSPEAQETDSK